jgi:hypothetical protein
VWVERELKTARGYVKFAVVEIQEWRGELLFTVLVFQYLIRGSNRCYYCGTLGLAVDSTTDRLMESYIFAQPGYIALSHHP